MSTNLEVGIVGLPNVGKSTLFNAITKAGAEAANYPFCTIEPNVGVVDVPDKRLSVLGEMVKAKKIVPAAMRFVDIAGLVKGASKGEGLGNKFLAHIREVDAVAQVVRCFEDGNITHVEGSIDPLRDIEIINTELCLADMESVEKRQERLVKLLKTGDKKVPIEKAVLDKVLAGLSEAVPARRLGLTEDELEFLKELHLLTMKPVLCTISLIISFVEPMLVPSNTVPSSKIRNAFICSPYPFVILFYSQKRGTLGVFSIPERPHFLKL